MKEAAFWSIFDFVKRVFGGAAAIEPGSDHSIHAGSGPVLPFVADLLHSF